MSILSGIVDFLKTELLGVEKTNEAPAVSSEQNLKKTPVIANENPGKNEDTLEISHQTNAGESKINKGATESLITNLASKYGINSKQLLNLGIIERVTGKTAEEFEQLSQAEKNIFIASIDYSMSKLSELEKNGKISQDANKEALVIAFGNVLFEALSKGGFKTTEEFDKAVGDIWEQLGKEFNSLPIDEQRRLLNNQRVINNKELEKELASVSNLPEDERKAAEVNIRQKHRYIRKGRFVQVAAQAKSETAMNALVILDSQDLKNGAEIVLSTRCSEAERTETADYADYNFTTGLIKDFKSFGDEISPNSLEGYTETVITYKSDSAVNEYQDAYTSDRDKYEIALKKQANGEPLSEEEKELLNLMSNEIFTATAKGIGLGALNNVNMTTEQKAGFLAKWEYDAKDYGDYDEVTAGVIAEMAKNPELKQEFEKAQTVLQKQTEEQEKNGEKIQKQTDNNSEAAGTEQAVSSSNVIITENSAAYTLADENRANTATNPILSENTNSVKAQTAKNKYALAADIQKSGVAEAVKKYGHSNVIEIILSNGSLKHLRSQLKPIIKSCDLNSLKKISSDCSDTSFLWICENVSSEYIAELKEFRGHLCYAANKQLEKMEEQVCN